MQMEINNNGKTQHKHSDRPDLNANANSNGKGKVIIKWHGTSDGNASGKSSETDIQMGEETKMQVEMQGKMVQWQTTIQAENQKGTKTRKHIIQMKLQVEMQAER